MVQADFLSENSETVGEGVVPPASIRSAAVVGGGFMGSGIAEATAVAGLPVTVTEGRSLRRDDVLDRIGESLGRAVRGGKLEQESVDAALSRITIARDLRDIAGVDLAIEVVPEDLSLKLEVMRGIEADVSAETVIASNTSSIPIAELAGALQWPERVCGLHFFAPVPVMKLVEVVVALDTSQETVARGRVIFARRSESARSRPRTDPASW